MNAAERLLALLVDAADGIPAPHEGSDGARRELERRGHRIETLPAASGARAPTWRLACARQHFSPSRFRAAQRGGLGSPLEIWESCDSTNAVAVHAAGNGAPHGALWLAEEQRRGRGRQGRTWHCPPHRGLLFSVLLRPSKALEQPQLLPLALALGICEGLRHASGCDVRLKWPNDLVVDACKLGGVLVEARSTPPAQVVVGCGLNLRVDPEALRRAHLEDATSLHAHVAHVPEREGLLARLLDRLESRFEDWSAGRHETLRSEWERYDVLRDRTVRVRSAAGEWAGVASGIGPDGALDLRLPDGSHRRFHAGEVHLT